MAMCHIEYGNNERYCLSMIDRQQLVVIMKGVQQELKDIDSELSAARLRSASGTISSRDQALGKMCDIQARRDKFQSLYNAIDHALHRND